MAKFWTASLLFLCPITMSLRAKIQGATQFNQGCSVHTSSAWCNKLHGCIQKSIPVSQAILISDLARNRLTGEIPRQI
ncbi:hypothetical protein RJT34_30687 [Clitoria ternatea]|uniref:Secreted protein n=1 Tax=Clitoria ternatea TaxID=43366 RepID=A0AAN9F0Q5_CLITE